MLTPDSPQSLDLTQGCNRRWSAPNCGTIFLPLTEAGAQEALMRAIWFGPGRFRVRGSGHCDEDFVFNDQTLAVIDVSLLNEIGFDAQNGVYYAQSGGTNWDLYRHLYWRYGLTLPAGSCYSVGLGGHICGGGYGLLSRQFGLTVDWLTGVRVVTVDQSHGTVFSRATKQDPRPSPGSLLGAYRRRGGNFGLVTRYEFARLPTAPRRAELIITAWNWSDIKDAADLGVIIAAFEQLVSAMPPTAFRHTQAIASIRRADRPDRAIDLRWPARVVGFCRPGRRLAGRALHESNGARRGDHRRTSGIPPVSAAISKTCCGSTRCGSSTDRAQIKRASTSRPTCAKASRLSKSRRFTSI